MADTPTPIPDTPPKGATWRDWVLWFAKNVLPLLLASAGSVGAYHLATRQADPTPADIAIDEEFVGDTGDLVYLKCETSGTKVRWRSLDPGLRLITDLPGLTEKKEARAFACKPGNYKVEVWSAIGGEPTAIYQTTVVVRGGPVPPTPPPPEPTPPTPTPPTPVPPSNPLTAKLKACWDADTTPLVVKQSQRNLITGLYEAMVDHAKNPAITTTGELLGDLKTQANAMLLPNALVECRKVISAEVTTALGTDATAKLDPDLRPKAIDVFDRIAKAMGGVK